MAAPRKSIVEDEDLDDLDDVLEQFNALPKPSSQPVPSSSKAASAPSKHAPSSSSQPSQQLATDLLEGLDGDFARELTKGMESLFRDIAQGAGLDDIPNAAKASGDPTDEAQEKAFRAAWEAMLVEGMNGAMTAEDVSAGAQADASAGSTTASGSGLGTSAGAEGDSFQDNVRKAMDKLKESDRMADEAASKGGDGLEDIFSRMSGDLDGAESEEELKGMLETMMSQLMSKEVLYEPLKELHDKFPSYLEDNASTLSVEDKSRYDAQYKIVTQIVATFEDPSYKDDDPQKGLKVVELMQEMQEHGSPPAEIMGPLPPGFDLGADGLPKIPEGCTVA